LFGHSTIHFFLRNSLFTFSSFPKFINAPRPP
jgi:hypothetical protein